MALIDDIRQLLRGIRDERNIAANTATRVGNAMLAMLNYIDVDGPFLRKDQADSTSFLLTLLAGAVIGESNNIRLNPDGSITCGRIRVNGSAIFDELVFNRQNILEGDTYFTDHAVVETAELVEVGTYLLTLRKMYDDDTLSFHVGDVLKGVVNNLDTEGTYYTSWSRVISVSTSTNQVRVVLYDGEDVPGGVNYPPCAPMNVVRWGNAVDQDRQSCFFVSATDKRFLFLQGVTQPILDDTNYSAFMGLPPDLDILEDLPLNQRQPYLYARGLIVQDIIRIDYQGNPVLEIRNRGEWDDETLYIKGKDPDSFNYYQDQVFHGGCTWLCAVTRATIGNAPRFNNADWICVSGRDNVAIDINSSAGVWFRSAAPFSTTLTAVVTQGTMVLLEGEIGRSNILWTRESSDTTGDAAWNAQHAVGTVGLSLSLTNADLPSDWLTNHHVAFRCAVTFPDGIIYNGSLEIVL